MKVGERIRQRREELGMTQDDLAMKLGLKTKSSVCQIESAGDVISTKNVIKYAEALYTTPAFLMGWSDEVIHSDLQDEILLYCTKLNDLGISKLLERAEELSLLDKYRRM